MTKKYAIFVIDGNGKLEIAAGFTKDHEWLPDMRFDYLGDAEIAIQNSYGYSENATLEFVILEVLCN